MTNETQAPQEGAFEVSKDNVASAPQTGKSDAASSPAPAAGKVMPTTEQRRRGGQKGGKTARHVALIGLPDALPTLSLRTSADRMAVLEAVLAAVARGKTSGMVAQTIISVVREARADATAELEAVAQAQAREIERLRSSRLA
jgi:hypothetical protein